MERANPHVIPSAMSVVAAWAAIAASGAALALLLSLHALSPQFSPAWRMISEYANGPYGWLLSLMFVAYGSSSIALAIAIKSLVNTRRGTLGVVFLALSGVGQLAAAQFDLNQAVLHEPAGVVGILCLPVAAVLISPGLAQTPVSAGGRKLALFAANLTWVTIVLWLASFVLMIATFLHALGGLPSTPPQELPAGVIAVVGWTNRMMVVSAWCWVVIVAWLVVRSRARAQIVPQHHAVMSTARTESV